jgi:hypothetical protein
MIFFSSEVIGRPDGADATGCVALRLMLGFPDTFPDQVAAAVLRAIGDLMLSINEMDSRSGIAEIGYI